MKQVRKLSDERLETWCIHCHGANRVVDKSTGKPVRRNRDHIPSKCLLAKPYPNNIPTLKICSLCNSSFSKNEEYVAAFLGSVAQGKHLSEKSLEILGSNYKLSDELLTYLTVQEDLFGNSRILLNLDESKINPVIEKNARGHFNYECSQVIETAPSAISLASLSSLSSEAAVQFEAIPFPDLLPEVGSRLFDRIFTGADIYQGWIIVQENQYRYAIIYDGESVVVRSVIQEEFITEVFWESAFG